jgi:hypothetical protein
VGAFILILIVVILIVVALRASRSKNSPAVAPAPYLDVSAPPGLGQTSTNNPLFAQRSVALNETYESSAFVCLHHVSALDQFLQEEQGDA